MKELMEGKSQLIAATNALGMGVDLPDIRVVIYTGQPQKLRDYTQKSRRAKRDCQSSEAIIVCSYIEDIQLRYRAKSQTQSRGEDIVDFVARYSCQQVTID